MCTVSWFKTEQGYELFFNRDEIKTRRRAQQPVIYDNHGVAIISPTDTDAGGTWISANHFGLTLCLLNHYEKEQLIPHTDWLSRGDVIRQLSIYESLAKIEYEFGKMDLKQFKPFRLYVLNRQGRSVFFTWDGQKMEKEYDTSTPRSSSSFKPEKVKQTRKQLYVTKGLANSVEREAYIDFHTSHEPDKSAYSVCMHRDNASTVSFSYIVVDERQVAFAYADGSPCEVPLGTPLEVSLVKTAIATNAA